MNELAQLPPHDPVAEQGVLGCFLLSPECRPEIISAFRGKRPFYDLRHQQIFNVLAQMHRAQQPIDPVTVQAWLKEAGILEQVGGFSYLVELEDSVPSVANLPAYLDIVREHCGRRKLVQTCQAALAQIYDPATKIEDLRASVQADFAEGLTGQDHDLPSIQDAADFISKLIEPPAELVAGILHRGSKLAFGGSSKSFKTWCLLYLALCVAFGVDWLGRATQQGKVLFVNFEIQPHSWQRRLVAVARAMGIELVPGWIDTWNLRGRAANFRQLIPKIIERCRKENYALIILDPIYKLYGGTDENTACDVAELLNEVERLATETGAAVAFGAHFAKGNASAKEAIDRISGSGVFARDPDSLLIFTRHEEDDAFTVEPILRDFAPVPPFAVRWEFPLMRLASDLDPAKLKQVAGRKPKHNPLQLLALIKDNDEQNPISVSEWSRLAEMPRKTLENYLAEMRQHKWIKTVGEGTKAKQIITNEGKAFINK